MRDAEAALLRALDALVRVAAAAAAVGDAVAARLGALAALGHLAEPAGLVELAELTKEAACVVVTVLLGAETAEKRGITTATGRRHLSSKTISSGLVRCRLAAVSVDDEVETHALLLRMMKALARVHFEHRELDDGTRGGAALVKRASTPALVLLEELGLHDEDGLGMELLVHRSSCACGLLRRFQNERERGGSGRTGGRSITCGRSRERTRKRNQTGEGVAMLPCACLLGARSFGDAQPNFHTNASFGTRKRSESFLTGYCIMQVKISLIIKLFLDDI